MIDWARPGTAAVLVGGQFGSEGKGLAAAWLARNSRRPIDIATTNAGAQAGHTTVHRDGTKFICYHLPTTPVELVYHEEPRCIAYINAGSIIDIAALRAEIEAVPINLNFLRIHPRAAVITPEDKKAEQAARSPSTMIASTQKGVGMAISNKVMRRGGVVENYEELDRDFHVEDIDLNEVLHRGASVVVEVPQGTDLSINHGLSYPYCTSRDCWVGSGLSDAGIHPSFIGQVCMVVRTLPIRVGHLFNEMGEKIGDSGPFYDDSQELDWERHLPGIEPERTTVTKRVRRIASWSDHQYAHALRLNRPSIVFMSFLNYLSNSTGLHHHVRNLNNVELYTSVHPTKIYSFGPCVEDCTTDYEQAMAWYEGNKF